MIDSLQAEFGIPDSVSLSTGRGDLAKVNLIHSSGASAEVYLHGGHVVSWKNRSGEELFFVSRESCFLPDRPIRGGIPIIFPQFGGGVLPAHGIARTSEWTVAKTEVTPSGDVSLELVLASDQKTRFLWPHDFTMRIRVVLCADSLQVRLAVENSGRERFDFQAVLHTYFRVEDIRKCTVRGLEMVDLIDSLVACAKSKEMRSSIRFEEETDRIYVRTPDSLQIDDEGRGHRISIEKRGMADVVVWNPWIDKSKRMSDFGDDEYLEMVCVETGVIAVPIRLAPGENWAGETVFSISAL
jgi:glucose-6-phosphate 1-epimerase